MRILNGAWEYLRWAITKDRTPPQYRELTDRLAANPKLLQSLHASIGIAGEAGELIDAIKKSAMYGKPLDVQNVKEELGDICWYMALMLESIGSNFSEVMQMNHDKLEKRYPSGFTEAAAQARADKAPLKALERKLKVPRASVSVSGFPCEKIQAIKLIRQYAGTSLHSAHQMVMNEKKQTIFRGKTAQCYELADSLLNLGINVRVVAK